MARIRSPNYPALSLPAAIEKVRAIHKAEGRNSVGRETLAKIIGFGGINGASATSLSALAKYGLLESAGDKEAKVTELAERILFPHEEGEKRRALLEAAQRPALFQEISEKWPDRPPSDENLKAFLIRNGFNQGSVDSVIQIYRDTIDIVGVPNVELTGPDKAKEFAPVNASHAPHSDVPRLPPRADVAPLAPSRPFSVSFDGSVLTGVLAIKKVKDLDRLMKVLAAQKAAFEAMEGDEDFDDLVGEVPTEDGDALS